MRTFRAVFPPLVKFGVFAALCLLCTALVANTLHRPFGRPTTGFTAVFADALGVKPGSEVRVAGVRVGKVNAVSLRDGTASVSFEVTDDQKLPADTTAVIRYADLLGARYVALSPGGGAVGPLAPGATIPLSRTKPALDLTVLFNGFKPIFEVLRPDDVNQLAKEIVAVFQGEGPTINALLSKVVSLTTTFSGQDKLIGEVLANLRPVLDSVIGHAQDFKDLIAGLGVLADGLAGNRQLIMDALDSGTRLAGTVADLVRQVQPSVNHDLSALNEVAHGLVRNEKPITEALKDLPNLLGKVDAMHSYGSWTNVYFCTLGIKIGGLTVDLGAGPHSEVCR
ncbi:MCE family protein [Amycolatopsis sp. NPDC059027]|uniref:MCE family protein n=1 Tax=Amycolatopsis sp. NPDC059027 TaxID=3346709 RepID=UPI00366BD53E